ncbi:MAG: cytochrome P450 [Blastochloris sp.]|nr:cytochrome P450 [Blastochloris sp.]
MSDTLGRYFNPLAEDPYPFYSRARQEEPITFCADVDAWIVTRYADIQYVLLHPEVFSSRDTLSPPVTFCPQALEELIKGFLPVPIVLNSDGADHARFRAPLMKAFAPSRVRSIEPFIRQVAHRLLDEVMEDGTTDLIRQFAYPLALEVILTLLGIPRQDIEQTRTWSHDWLTLLSIQLDEEQQVACARGTVAFQQYLACLIAERRTEPQDDLISLLIHMPSEEPFTENELIITLQGLILAGHESTTNMIGNGMRLLLEHPQSWQMLCHDPEQIPQAVEEILRYDAPIQMFARTTTQQTAVGGVTLPKDTSLLLIYGSANRDDVVFPEAEQFQIQRPMNQHLAFGHGVHFCVGAALARLEGRIAFEVLCQRLPHVQLVPGQALQHIPTLLFRGYQQLHVTWD